MKNLIRASIAKIKKERWHLHFGYSALLALPFCFFTLKESELITACVAGATLFVIGIIWEFFFYFKSNAEIDFRDALANALGAFSITLITQLMI